MSIISALLNTLPFGWTNFGIFEPIMDEIS